MYVMRHTSEASLAAIAGVTVTVTSIAAGIRIPAVFFFSATFTAITTVENVTTTITTPFTVIGV